VLREEPERLPDRLLGAAVCAMSPFVARMLAMFMEPLLTLENR